MESIILLRAMAQNKSSIGNVMRLQGIRDIIQDFIFQYRDIFTKELVKNNAILYGAHSMWLKKQRTIVENYNNRNTTLDVVNEIEGYYMEFWDLILKTKTWDEHIEGMLSIQLHGQDWIDYENELNAYNEDEDARYDAFMKAYYDDMREEERIEAEIDRVADMRNDRW